MPNTGSVVYYLSTRIVLTVGADYPATITKQQTLCAVARALEAVRNRALATLGFAGRAKRTTDMETEQQGEDVAIGAYKLINIDVDPEFGADCKAWATSAITSYHKGEKNHFQDVAQAIKQGECCATHAPRNN